MKSVARAYVWWLQMDVHIEETVSRCTQCQKHSKDAPVHHWEKPWKRIHIDFAGPFEDSALLLVVHTHTKWPEVFPMSTTTASKTLQF